MISGVRGAVEWLMPQGGIKTTDKEVDPVLDTGAIMKAFPS